MFKTNDISLQHARQFAESIRMLKYADDIPVTMTCHSPGGHVSYQEAMKGRYRPIKEGAVFTEMFSRHWFKINATVPKAWAGSDVVLVFEHDGEALIWKDGAPIQSITNTDWVTPQYAGPIRPYCRMVKKARGGEKVSCVVEMACCGYWGYLVQPFRGSSEVRKFPLKRVRLVRFDALAWELWVLLDTLLRSGNALQWGSPRRAAANAAAVEMTRLCVVNDRSTWPAAIAAGKCFFDAKQTGHAFEISAIGEAHIDTGWLWPVEETKRKCAGAFSSVLRLMEDYPELKYSCSQALQLKWMRDLYPAVWKQIQARFKQGRFIPIGGAWIEPDCNVPSGESLVRQFLFGQRFFRKEFGMTCREFWQPDVFGYSAALPQIIRLAGMKNFFTGKLWGNQFNKPVNTTFLWEGIDGSSVLTHLPASGGSMMDPEAIMNTINHCKELDRSNEMMLPFGIGDAGGAPTELMMDRYHLLKDTAGFPRIRIRSVPQFFERCEKDIQDPIRWVGELYYEDHRGTYTTQAAVKRDNRRSEELLHDIEFLATAVHALKRGRYPGQAINDLWELVLLDQFHDILPGTSIPEVYDVTRRDYRQIATDGSQLKAKALANLTGDKHLEPLTRDASDDRPFGAMAVPALSTKKPNLLVTNSLGFERSDIVDTASGPVRVTAPSMGYAVMTPAAESVDRVIVTKTRTGVVLENNQVRATLNNQGRLVGFYDKRHSRETIAKGGHGNQFVLFEDSPNSYDAWNVEVYHLQKRRDVGTVTRMSVSRTGGLLGSITLISTLTAKSVLTQTISLAAKSCRLDFDCQIDWHESNQMLKVEFPLAVHADHATYEIQFGHLRRPTHFNTSWDVARFEVAAQRWADLSESNFGVALLNDSKYGYACHGHVMRLSLLRSPTWPDAKADMGRHGFRYALYPHAGSPQAGGVVHAAMAFNQPLSAQATGLKPVTQTFFEINNPAIIIDTVKKAEDSNDLIVRLYESSGGHQVGRLMSSLPIIKAQVVNLLEDDLSKAAWRGGLTVELKPFEIVTYKLVLAARR